MANEKFVPVCDGINGSIGALTIDLTYQGEAVDFPIDALVINLLKEEVDTDEIAADSVMADDWI